MTLLGNITGAIPTVTSALLDGSGSSGSQPLLGTDQQ